MYVLLLLPLPPSLCLCEGLPSRGGLLSFNVLTKKPQFSLLLDSAWVFSVICPSEGRENTSLKNGRAQSLDAGGIRSVLFRVRQRPSTLERR